MALKRRHFNIREGLKISTGTDVRTHEGVMLDVKFKLH